jgi:ABC-type lipoprotein release transport system permease subunit
MMRHEAGRVTDMGPLSRRRRPCRLSSSKRIAHCLIEAVVLSLFGGTIGISLALAASHAAARALSLPFALDCSIIALAFVFSAAVGIVFGFFPARRAASLNPIEALRHE